MRTTRPLTLTLLLSVWLCSAGSTPAAAASPPMAVGVTLHPYFSWVKNIVSGTEVEVRSIVPGDIDVGDYQPRPEEVEKIIGLDAIVVNGVGHDDFIFDMIRASGNAKVKVLRPNDGVPLIRSAHGNAVNSHTFISFSNAIAQTYAIARELGALRPDLADAFQRNAATYARRLREMKSKAAVRLVDARVDRVVTVHDGYVYLMQEFGIEIAGVVQPTHGLVPSAAELGQMVDLLKKEHARVVFSEESFPEPLLKVLREEGGARVYLISHIASGPFTADRFETDMQKNVDAIVQALVIDQGR
ncbi:MAG: zinc ABC transporter substrate-binding protein [Deltaproteobacteria bacterium]|nr:zinc ABC transporter substrate-binding protein [Deltaproteobacteria bacterium]